MTRIAIVIAASLAFAATLSAVPAQAQRARVFVASYGNDGNPCTFGSPCKTFQQAVTTVAAGGEVTAIDSAGFGPITIMKSVTITSPNGVEAGIAIPSGGTGITIDAGPSDVVSLRGLTLDGAGVGTNGIVFGSGASLTIESCVVRNMTQYGIYYAPSGASSLAVSDTLVDNTGLTAVYVIPTGSSLVTAVFNRVEVDNSLDGITATGAFSTGTINVTVSNSVIAGNNHGGVAAASQSGNAPVNLILFRSVVANTAFNGISSGGLGATFLVSQSVVTGNGSGWFVSSPGILQSYGDNKINLNRGSQGQLPAVTGGSN
jgi:hypothetical protein